MAGLWRTPAAKRRAFECLASMDAQIAIGQDVGFKLLDDFLASPIPAFMERIVPYAFGNLEPGNFAPDVNPSVDDDLAILPDGGIARANVLAFEIDECRLPFRVIARRALQRDCSFQGFESPRLHQFVVEFCVSKRFELQFDCPGLQSPLNYQLSTINNFPTARAIAHPSSEASLAEPDACRDIP